LLVKWQKMKKGFDMSFEISKSYELAVKALDYRSIRADMISGNIANIDTPGYKARDIGFEYALQKEADKIYGSNNSEKLKLAKTNPEHLSGLNDDEDVKPVIFYRDGQDARNDGNTVDLDVETTELAKNETIYNALIAALKKDGSIFRSVIDASAKV